MQKTKYHSWKKGNLAKGCQLCVKGAKSVFFITGKCSCNCFYCPISDLKKNKDIVYINEWPTRKEKDILQEIKLCDSKGVGITGGDPLCCLDRTVKWIKRLKKEFGKKFHIHLYTSLNHVSRENLSKLWKSGLDEIRFHPSLETKKFWNRLELASAFDWDIGVEIPAIPGKMKITKELIDFIADKVDFLNINELETADNKFNRLAEMGYRTKNKLSYAVKGSEEMALKLIRYVEDKKHKMNVHYCTAKLKDKVQMTERIKKRAENVALDTDIITDSGMLIRGVVFSTDVKKVKKIMKNVYLDKQKKRILVDAEELLKNDKKMKGFKCAIVEEYPTHDHFQVEVDFV